MKEEVKRLQDQETKDMEQELEAAKQRQKAIDDLDKGVCVLSLYENLKNFCFYFERNVTLAEENFFIPQ